ncbi:hypothetical protein HII31_02590 [Pseudocercospora fuligena]|uniref:Uncharacterized protein n=1 Tax=Pseudocercospora fuligena TaxID=685502 RepID=A0A8H6RS33_9PEZI|nr:hypothetical protein HII31_02590 [Pseudocercospora fuligena]
MEGANGTKPRVGSVSEVNASSSPLLRLPPELRIQIFEHVLANKLIHVGLRPCQPNEDGGITYSSIAYDFVDRYKPMYAVCKSVGVHWDQAYAESCSPPDVLDHSYTAEHLACHSIMNDLRWQDYMGRPVFNCDCALRPCFHFFSHRRSLIEQYGEPPEGVHRMHADTKLDLSLLLVCRQIYKDAALLPFSGNTFGFMVPLDLNVFLEEVLQSHQRNAIQRIQAFFGAMSKPTLPGRIPSGLQRLNCYIRIIDFNLESEEFREPAELETWVGEFENVEVIVGDGGIKPISKDKLLLRRQWAERFEQLLTKPRRGSVVSTSQLSDID